MCGIVGYVGTQQAAPLLLEGLTRLEHRGYDSAGPALPGSAGIKGGKRAGRVRAPADGLPKRFAGKVGIGHTRWATHGPANDVNAHPHTDAKGLVAVVHNGIIDNAAALRHRLADEGVDLVSTRTPRGRDTRSRPPARPPSKGRASPPLPPAR